MLLLSGCLICEQFADIGEFMHKYLLNILAATFLCFLVGCQSNRVNDTFFGPSFAPAPSATTLDQSVRNALMRSEDPAIAQVRVETRQNVVVLSGYVKKIRQSDVAEQIARQVPGVQSVENRIIIRP